MTGLRLCLMRPTGMLGPFHAPPASFDVHEPRLRELHKWLLQNIRPITLSDIHAWSLNSYATV